jgi:hypothetical protein
VVYSVGQSAPRDGGGILPPGIVLSIVTLSNKKTSRFWVADSYGIAVQTMTRTTRAKRKLLRSEWNFETNRAYLVPWYKVLSYRMIRSRGGQPYSTNLILKTAATHHSVNLVSDPGKLHGVLGPWLAEIERRKGRPGAPVAAPKQV